MLTQLFKGALLTFAIGIVVFMAESFAFQYLPLFLLLVPILFVLPNFIILSVLFYTKILKGKLTGTPFLIIEILLLYGIHYCVNAIINSLPEEIRFEKTPNSYGLKLYFEDSFKLVYTYFILIIVIVLIRLAHDFYNKKKGEIKLQS
jgi:hypothetical protein